VNPTLANVLGTMFAVLLAAVTPYLVLMAKRAGEYLAELGDGKLSERQKADLEWAVRTSVDAAQEAGAAFFGDQAGARKMELAKRSARSLAPKAISKLDEQQLTDVVNAAVQRKRTSTPAISLMPMAGSLYPMSFAPKTWEQVPDVVFPPPSRVPGEPPAVEARDDESDTRPGRPRTQGR
jgi:hypothetical protein